MDASTSSRTDQPAQAPGAPQPWSVTLAVGLAALGLTLLVSSAHLLAVDALAGPVLVLPALGTVSLVLAAAVRRGGRRAAIAALVFAVLVTLGNLGHLADTLRLPDSAWDFIPNLVAAVALLLVLPAAVARVAGASSSIATQRRLWMAAGTVVVIGAAVSLTMTVADPAVGVDRAGLPVVETADNDYMPGELTVTAGSDLVLDNRDGYAHTFTVEALGIDVHVAGDREALVAVPAAAATGSYEVICILHPGIMTATLVVEGT
jgi:plastocyanin